MSVTYENEIPVMVNGRVKCSVRQTRQGCGYCGERGWLYHQPDRPGNDAGFCDVHKSKHWVLCDEQGNPHTCEGTRGAGGVEITPSLMVSLKSAPKEEESPAPPPAPPKGGPDMHAAQAALAQLLAAAAPQQGLNESEVEAIVGRELRKVPNESAIKVMLAAELSKIPGALPLRIEIPKPGGEPRKIPGISHKALPEVLGYVNSGVQFGERVNVWMHGPGGTGKSSIAPQIASALDVPFYPISLGPGTTQSSLMGYVTADGYQETAWVKAMIGGGLVLLDEADAAHPAIVTVLNAALANEFVGLPDGRTIKVHQQFFAIAAGNTTGNGADRVYKGRNGLDKAFLDRFEMVHVGYDDALELSACRKYGLPQWKLDKLLEYVRSIRANVIRQEMPELVGMRASIGAARALASGVPWGKVIESRIRHGMSDRDWTKVIEGVVKPAL
jgi:cobaltochelatase CobS